MAKIHFSGSVESYNKSIELIIAQTAKAGIETPLVNKIKLMCQEIIFNIIKHAYAGNSGEIDIECDIKKNDYIIVIKDFGKPFNSLAKKAISGSRDDTPAKTVSDFGKLFTGAFDSAEYIRIGDSNVVTLKKHLSAGSL